MIRNEDLGLNPSSSFANRRMGLLVAQPAALIAVFNSTCFFTQFNSIIYLSY